jgi:AraC-like DNA-binding protein
MLARAGTRPGVLERRRLCGVAFVSVSIVLVRAFVEVVERSGVGRERLLATTNVDPGRLDAGGARLEFAEFTRLQARALDLTGDEALGLHIAEHASEAAFDLVAHLIVHAPTLRDGVELCLRFQRVFSDDAELTLVEKDDSATLRLAFSRATLRTDRMYAEFVMAGLLRMIRSFAASAAVRSVSFEHPRPDHHLECARVFGGAERYRQAFTGIEVDRKILDRPCLHSNAELYGLLLAQAERMLSQVTRGVGQAERLKQYFLARPPLGAMPEMAQVARDMGMSVRSLRRRLTEEGVSYRAVLEEALGMVATRMLGDSRRSIQETAHAMGFSDSTAFHRAFKRWTGMTPKQFRERPP